MLVNCICANYVDRCLYVKSKTDSDSDVNSCKLLAAVPLHGQQRVQRSAINHYVNLGTAPFGFRVMSQVYPLVELGNTYTISTGSQ